MAGKMNWDRTRREQAIKKHGSEFNNLPSNYRERGKEGKELSRPQNPSGSSFKDKPVVVIVKHKSKIKKKKSAENFWRADDENSAIKAEKLRLSILQEEAKLLALEKQLLKHQALVIGINKSLEKTKSRLSQMRASALTQQ